MSSNLTSLKNLLVTCPDCENGLSCETCEMLEDKEFVSYLIELYKMVMEEEIKSIDDLEFNINLDEDEYDNYPVNHEMIDYLNEHLNKIISSDPLQEDLKLARPLAEIIKNIEQDSSMDNIVDALVFDVCDIILFKHLFEKYSNQFCKYFKNRSSIEMLITKYIDLAKNDKTEKITFLAVSKIISYIINNDNLSLTAKERNRYLQILYIVSSKLNSHKYNNYERKRIISALNLLIDNIKDEKPKTKEEFDANINVKYGIKPNFSEKALEELKNIKMVNNKLYVDLTDKYIISIDRSKYSCSEDAFSIELLPNGNYLFGIYITDVYSYINEDSILELEAFERAKTIYLPFNAITMFPEELVYNTLSLSTSGNKYVIASLFELSPTFDLINHEIVRAIISLNANKSFDEVENDVKYGHDSQVSDKYYETIMKLSSHIKRTNPNLAKYCNNLENCSIESIIESFVVYYSEQVQNTYELLDLPCIYKIIFGNQGMLKPGKPKQPLSAYVIECLKQLPLHSVYSVDKKMYPGSNVCIRMPLTSPARNFASLQNQKLVQKYWIDRQRITDKEIYKLEEQLKIISQHMNEKEKLINEYIEEYNYKIKQYKRK